MSLFVRNTHSAVFMEHIELPTPSLHFFPKNLGPFDVRRRWEIRYPSGELPFVTCNCFSMPIIHGNKNYISLLCVCVFIVCIPEFRYVDVSLNNLRLSNCCVIFVSFQPERFFFQYVIFTTGKCKGFSQFALVVCGTSI